MEVTVCLLEEFGSPIYGKRRLKERHVYFHENTGRESVLEYDVEHHDEVLHFRQEKFGVVEAKCNHGLMKLKFKSSEGVFIGIKPNTSVTKGPVP